METKSPHRHLTRPGLFSLSGIVESKIRQTLDFVLTLSPFGRVIIHLTHQWLVALSFGLKRSFYALAESSMSLPFEKRA